MRHEREQIHHTEPLSGPQMSKLIRASVHTLGNYEYTENFFRRYPDEARILSDATDTVPVDAPWSERFVALEKLFSLWGIREVDDTMVSDILTLAYDRSHTDHSQWANHARKVAAVRAGQPVEILDRVRSLLPEKPSFNETRQYEAFSYLESSHHPLSHLVPKIGYEVETEATAHINVDKMNILHLLGFGTDQDIYSSHSLVEYAHGPFQDWKTASYALGKFISVGAIDLYKAYGQSMHTNLGIKYHDGFPTLNRWLMATGWAYQPIFSSVDAGINEFFDIKIKPKVSDELYMESKEFRLIDYRSAVKHFRASQMLATALNAYQQAQLAYYRGSPNELITQRKLKTLSEADIWEMKRKPEISRKIDQAPLTKTQKQLAHLWYESTKLLQKGFASVELDDMWRQYTPVTQENYFAELFAEVYPDSRWKSTREISAPHEIVTTPVILSGMTYPNIISFSRQLATDTVSSIEQVLGNAEQEFNRRVVDIGNQTDKTQRYQMLNALFRNFPCGFHQGTSITEKYQFILDNYLRVTNNDQES